MFYAVDNLDKNILNNFLKLLLKLSLDGTPSPTRTDMNRSSTDFESVVLGLGPMTTLTF